MLSVTGFSTKTGMPFSMQATAIKVIGIGRADGGIEALVLQRLSTRFRKNLTRHSRANASLSACLGTQRSLVDGNQGATSVIWRALPHQARAGKQNIQPITLYHVRGIMTAHCDISNFRFRLRQLALTPGKRDSRLGISFCFATHGRTAFPIDGHLEADYFLVLLYVALYG